MSLLVSILIIACHFLEQSDKVRINLRDVDDSKQHNTYELSTITINPEIHSIGWIGDAPAFTTNKGLFQMPQAQWELIQDGWVIFPPEAITVRDEVTSSKFSYSRDLDTICTSSNFVRESIDVDSTKLTILSSQMGLEESSTFYINPTLKVIFCNQDIAILVENFHGAAGRFYSYEYTDQLLRQVEIIDIKTLNANISDIVGLENYAGKVALLSAQPNTDKLLIYTDEGELILATTSL